MFGILYLITGLVGKIGWSIKKNSRNIKCAKRTYNSKTNTYIDMYGVERTPNGKYCKTTTDIKTGDIVQYNNNYQIIRNISEEDRIKEYANDCYTVVRDSENRVFKDEKKYIVGVRYTDKKTGKKYVIRMFEVEDNGKKHRLHFYMDANNGKLIRLTDGEILYGTYKNQYIIQKFINSYNYNVDNKNECLFFMKYNSKNNGIWCDDDRKPVQHY